MGWYGYQMCQTDAGQPFYASSTLLPAGMAVLLTLETVVAAYLLFAPPAAPPAAPPSPPSSLKGGGSEYSKGAPV